MNNIRSLLNGSCDLDLIKKNLNDLHKVNMLILELINNINKQIMIMDDKIISYETNKQINNNEKDKMKYELEEIKKVLEILINKYNLHYQLII